MPQSCKLALLLQRVELILQRIDLCPKFLIAVVCDLSIHGYIVSRSIAN